MTLVADGSSLTFSEELLCDQPPADRDYFVTGDAQHIVWFAQVGSGLVLVIDGVAHDPFDEFFTLRDNTVVFMSPDRRRYAFMARRGDAFFVCCDGLESPQYVNLTRSVPPTFSPDGRRLAYGAKIDDRFQLVLDGAVVDAALGELAPRPPVFSNDGERIAYVAVRATDSVPHQFVVVDGAADQEYAGIGNGADALVFSADGNRLAYAADLGPGWRYVIDGIPGPSFDAVSDFVFSPDGGHWAHLAVRAGKVGVVRDGSAPQMFDRVLSPTFSPDGRRLAFVTAQHGFSRAHDIRFSVDGELGPPWDEFHTGVAFSPDSRHVAYLAAKKRGGFLERKLEWRAVVDGEAGDPFDEVTSDAHWSPDSRHLAFAARRGKESFILIDGIPGPAFDRVGAPLYTSSGSLVYPGIRGGTSFLLVDHAELGDSFDALLGQEPFIVDPTGRHVLSSRLMGEARYPAVDGVLGRRYESISGPEVGTNGTAAWMGVREGGAWRVRCSLA